MSIWLTHPQIPGVQPRPDRTLKVCQSGRQGRAQTAGRRCQAFAKGARQITSTRQAWRKFPVARTESTQVNSQRQIGAWCSPGLFNINNSSMLIPSPHYGLMWHAGKLCQVLVRPPEFLTIPKTDPITALAAMCRKTSLASNLGLSTTRAVKPVPGARQILNVFAGAPAT